MPAVNDEAIRVEGLVKVLRGHLGIGRTVAVDGLELTVRRGEIFGLLGPNGAGKTTTLKLMLGLLRPDRGRVSLLGRSCDDPAARARVGFLPENPYFYDYLTAGEFLDFYGRLQGMPSTERTKRVSAALARVGLAGRDRVALRKFSKGMTQRLGLAQAIQHEPELVILDEPMSGLDPVGRREVRDLILSLREEGRTVFFSSHILQDAELLCDRAVILRDGRVRWSGDVRSLAGSSVRWFEVVLRGAVAQDLPGERVSVAGDEVFYNHGPNVMAVRIDSVWPRRETLEDLFLREIGEHGEEEARP